MTENNKKTSRDFSLLYVCIIIIICLGSFTVWAYNWLQQSVVESNFRIDCDVTTHRLKITFPEVDIDNLIVKGQCRIRKQTDKGPEWISKEQAEKEIEEEVLK